MNTHDNRPIKIRCLEAELQGFLIGTVKGLRVYLIDKHARKMADDALAKAEGIQAKIEELAKELCQPNAPAYTSLVEPRDDPRDGTLTPPSGAELAWSEVED